MSFRIFRRGITFAPTVIPKFVPGLLAWYRADMGVSLNGSNVTSWADSSGYGYPAAIQSNTSYQPTLISSDSSYNNNASINLSNGTYLQSSSNIPNTISQPFTWFIVGQTNNNYSGSIFVDINVAFLEVANQWQLYAGTSPLSGSVTANLPYIFCCVFNNGSSQLYVNSKNITYTQSIGPNSMSGPIYFSSYNPPQQLGGKLTEFIAYNGILSSSNITLILNYLSSRYAIAIS